MSEGTQERTNEQANELPSVHDRGVADDEEGKRIDWLRLATVDLVNSTSSTHAQYEPKPFPSWTQPLPHIYIYIYMGTPL